MSTGHCGPNGVTFYDVSINTVPVSRVMADDLAGQSRLVGRYLWLAVIAGVYCAIAWRNCRTSAELHSKLFTAGLRAARQMIPGLRAARRMVPGLRAARQMIPGLRAARRMVPGLRAARQMIPGLRAARPMVHFG